MEVCFNCNSEDIEIVDNSIWCSDCNEYVGRKKIFTILSGDNESEEEQVVPVSVKFHLTDQLDPDEEEELVEKIDTLLEANAEELLPEHSAAEVISIETTEDLVSFDDIIAQFAEHQYGNYAEEDRLGIEEYPNLKDRDYLKIGREIFDQDFIDYVEKRVHEKIEEFVKE